MDAVRFDALARALSSRRVALAGLLVSTLGLLGRHGIGDILAHDPSRKCKKKSGDQKKKCLKKAKKHKAQHAREAPPAPTEAPPAPTCSDGIKNGSETGVDCGGTCQRCATGQGCTSPNDCASAFCSGGSCQTCTMDPCGSDVNGACICRGTDPPTANVCVTNSGRIADCGSGGAESCPPGEFCINNVGIRACYKPCGAP